MFHRNPSQTPPGKQLKITLSEAGFSVEQVITVPTGQRASPAPSVSWEDIIEELEYNLAVLRPKVSFANEQKTVDTIPGC